MTDVSTYYEYLHLPDGASAEEIRFAYQKLTRELSLAQMQEPSEELQQRLQQIDKAYAMLVKSIWEDPERGHVPTPYDKQPALEQYRQDISHKPGLSLTVKMQAKEAALMKRAKKNKLRWLICACILACIGWLTVFNQSALVDYERNTTISARKTIMLRDKELSLRWLNYQKEKQAVLSGMLNRPVSDSEAESWLPPYLFPEVQ